MGIYFKNIVLYSLFNFIIITSQWIQWMSFFPFLNQSFVPCLVLTCFLTCIQISQEAGQVVWYFCLLKNFPQFVVILTVKGFSVVNEAEEDIFLELSCFFHDPTDVGSLISGSSAFSKSSLSIWKFTVHVFLKPGLENFEDHLAAVWDVCNCAAVGTFFGTAFLWDWNENGPLSTN